MPPFTDDYIIKQANELANDISLICGDKNHSVIFTALTEVLIQVFLVYYREDKTRRDSFINSLNEMINDRLDEEDEKQRACPFTP